MDPLGHHLPHINLLSFFCFTMGCRIRTKPNPGVLIATGSVFLFFFYWSGSVLNKQIRYHLKSNQIKIISKVKGEFMIPGCFSSLGSGSRFFFEVRIRNRLSYTRIRNPAVPFFCSSNSEKWSNNLIGCNLSIPLSNTTLPRHCFLSLCLILGIHSFS